MTQALHFTDHLYRRRDIKQAKETSHLHTALLVKDPTCQKETPKIPKGAKSLQFIIL